MILKALCDLAESEELMGDPDFEWKPVAYLVRVDDGGKLLGIEGTHTVPEDDGATRRKKKPRPMAKNFKVPREPGRTSGDRANFLIDKAEYALGLDPETDEAKRRPAEKLAKRFALFQDRVRQCLDATHDPGVAAVDAFLSAVKAGDLTVPLPEGCAGNDLFAFVYGSDRRLVTLRDKVRAYWQDQRREAAGDAGSEQLCLVTGRVGPPADKHTILKNVPGAVSSGVPLVSVNAKAFESYGWSGNRNAVISSQAAETYATALQRLLHPAPPDPGQPGATLPRQNLRLSDDTALCYWTPKSDFGSFLGNLLELGDVPEIYQAIWKGRVPRLLEEPEDAADFYALTLSGAQGRVIVRGWIEATVPKVAANLARYFSDIEIVRNTPKPKDRELPPRLPLRDLLQSLAVQGKGDNRRGPLCQQFLDAGLRGTPFPLAAMQNAVQRTRAEIGRTDWNDLLRRDARAAIIKAVLNRRHADDPHPHPKFKEIKPQMDPNNDNPGYLLGRLMAVIERLQQLALGDVKASVVDRYFSAASAAPRSVFVRLLKNARHHARKAIDEDRTKGSAIWLEKQIDELADRFDPKNNGFPAHLSLEEQGLFILGYHQQRHAFFMTKDERAAAQAEQEQAAA
jgi:CRISPR-associated protein Csd1